MPHQQRKKVSKTATKTKQWEIVQIKAFTQWVNEFLGKRNLELKDIRIELDDGVRLINFLEELIGKTMKEKWIKKPPSRIQKITNLHLALKFLEHESDIHLVGVSAEDFADHNLKIILGFLWTIFKRFRIQTIKHEDKSSEAGLLSWCKEQTFGYRDVSIDNFSHSFRSGMAFLALIDRYLESNKEVIDYDQFSKEDSSNNLEKAFELAEKHMGVPKLLDAIEVSESSADSRSMVLYVSLLFHSFVAKKNSMISQEEREKTAAEMKLLNASLEEKAHMAVGFANENERLQKELEEMRNERDESREEKLYLSEKVDVMKQILHQNEDDKDEMDKQRVSLEQKVEELQEELESTKTLGVELEQTQKTLKNQLDAASGNNQALTELRTQMEGQIDALKSQVEQLEGGKEKMQQDLATNIAETQSRNNTELRGLGVMKKNLGEHLEDLHRWAKFLNLEDTMDLDFSGEVRPAILSEISNDDFDDQLTKLAEKLGAENGELEKYLHAKETEAAAKKASQKVKKKSKK